MLYQLSYTRLSHNREYCPPVRPPVMVGVGFEPT
jgi:hypothetical protein